MTIRRITAGPGLPAGFPFSLASEANVVVRLITGTDERTSLAL
jgi:hypothetical protein